MSYCNLSICIPAYNESEGIIETLRNLRNCIEEAEIILVDDGSTDGTAELASSIDGVIVVSHARNRGYGASLKTAMKHSSRPVVAWYDADGQHNPEDLKRVSLPVLKGEKDAVIGVRGTSSDVRLDRLPGKWVLKFIAEFVVNDRVPDLNSGLRCINKCLILKYLHLLPDGFSASSTSTLIIMKRGYRLGYETITTAKRIGKSTVSIVRDGARTVHLILRIMILFHAFPFFAALSAFQLFASIFYGVFIALSYGRGFPVLAGVVFTSGVMTFFMGLICDQIVALRMERLEENNQSLICKDIVGRFDE